MTEETAYRCDVTGNVFHDRSEVTTITVRSRGKTRFEHHEYDIHISDQSAGSAGVSSTLPGRQCEYLGVVDGEIVGAVFETRGVTRWHDRGDPVIGHHEEAFEFIETEADLL